MTKAERMREVMNKAIEEKRVINVEKNRKYANRIVNGKCHKRALKGFNHCEVKLSRFYNPTLTTNVIEEMGFEVKRNSKNGRAVLNIKW